VLFKRLFVFLTFNKFWQFYFRQMTNPKKSVRKDSIDDQDLDKEMTDENSFDPIDKKNAYDDDDDDDFDLPLDDLDTFDDFDDDDESY
jgi:hypothetical protein